MSKKTTTPAPEQDADVVDQLADAIDEANESLESVAEGLDRVAQERQADLEQNVADALSKREQELREEMIRSGERARELEDMMTLPLLSVAQLQARLKRILEYMSPRQALAIVDDAFETDQLESNGFHYAEVRVASLTAKPNREYGVVAEIKLVCPLHNLSSDEHMFLAKRSNGQREIQVRFADVQVEMAESTANHGTKQEPEPETQTELFDESGEPANDTGVYEFPNPEDSDEHGELSDLAEPSEPATTDDVVDPSDT